MPLGVVIHTGSRAGTRRQHLVYVVRMMWGSRFAKAVRVILAVVVTGAVALPANSASASDGVIEERCSQPTAQYSHDRWQYGEITLCARKDGSTIFYSVTTADIQYHWGGAWYYNKYWVRLQTRLVLLRDGGVVNSQTRNKLGKARTVTSRGSIAASAPGIYTLVVQADAAGLYWSRHGDSAIISEPIRLELVVA